MGADDSKRVVSMEDFRIVLPSSAAADSELTRLHEELQALSLEQLRARITAKNSASAESRGKHSHKRSKSMSTVRQFATQTEAVAKSFDWFVQSVSQ